jgi:formate dehydrogenase major subunit
MPAAEARVLPSSIGKEVQGKSNPVGLPIEPIDFKERGRRNDMEVSRRGFLKISGATALAGGLGLSVQTASAQGPPPKILYTRETTSICPYCAVGCGIIVHTRDGRVINTEGDPDHPINQGSLCPKGSSLYQLSDNPNRLTKPLYRAPYAKEWKEVSWEWALDKIADYTKTARDASFMPKNEKGETVNRTDAIASVGSAAMDNEECYVYQKFLRAVGLVYIEHQARI